jgi:hypothetical protein
MWNRRLQQTWMEAMTSQSRAISYPAWLTYVAIGVTNGRIDLIIGFKFPLYSYIAT